MSQPGSPQYLILQGLQQAASLRRFYLAQSNRGDLKGNVSSAGTSSHALAQLSRTPAVVEFLDDRREKYILLYGYEDRTYIMEGLGPKNELWRYEEAQLAGYIDPHDLRKIRERGRSKLAKEAKSNHRRHPLHDSSALHELLGGLNTAAVIALKNTAGSRRQGRNQPRRLTREQGEVRARMIDEDLRRLEAAIILLKDAVLDKHRVFELSYSLSISRVC